MKHTLEAVTKNDRVILHNIIVAIRQAQGTMPSASHLQNLMFFLEIEYFAEMQRPRLEGAFRMGVLGAVQSGVCWYLKKVSPDELERLQTITPIDDAFGKFFRKFIKEYKSVSEFDLMCRFFDLIHRGLYSTGDFLYVNVLSDLLKKQKRENESKGNGKGKIKQISVPF